jgi:gliding motility-associated-like protein
MQKSLVNQHRIVIFTFMSRHARISLIFIAVLFSSSCFSQVANGGFELNTGLPSSTGEWSLAEAWSNASSIDASPDYYHLNGSFGGDLPETPLAMVSPHEGNAIMGFVASGVKGTNYREYIVNELATPLELGKKYQLSFYITNGERTAASSAGLACSDLGVCFSTSEPIQIGTAPINAVPDFVKQNVIYDRNWTSISFAFIATENYTHFTLGLFGDDSDKTIVNMEGSNAALAYYFVDQFEIQELDEGFVSDSDPKSEDRTPEVVQEIDTDHFFIPNAFTPNGDGDNDVFLPISSEIDQFTLRVFNKWGQLVFETDDVNRGWNGECKEGNEATIDMYVWEISYVNNDLQDQDKLTTFTGTVNLIK